MAERLGTSLQNCVQRFKSARDLQKTQHDMCWVFLLDVTEGECTRVIIDFVQVKREKLSTRFAALLNLRNILLLKFVSFGPV